MNEFWRSPCWLPLLAKGNTRTEELTSTTIMSVTRRWLEHRLIGTYTSRLNPSTKSISLNTFTLNSHDDRGQHSAATDPPFVTIGPKQSSPVERQALLLSSSICLHISTPVLFPRFVFNLARLLKPIYYIDMLIYANYTGFLLLSLAFVTVCVCVCMHVCMYNVRQSNAVW